MGTSDLPDIHAQRHIIIIIIIFPYCVKLLQKIIIHRKGGGERESKIIATISSLKHKLNYTAITNVHDQEQNYNFKYV